MQTKKALFQTPESLKSTFFDRVFFTALFQGIQPCFFLVMRALTFFQAGQRYQFRLEICPKSACHCVDCTSPRHADCPKSVRHCAFCTSPRYADCPKSTRHCAVCTRTRHADCLKSVRHCAVCTSLRYADCPKSARHYAVCTSFV